MAQIFLTDSRLGDQFNLTVAMRLAWQSGTLQDATADRFVLALSGSPAIRVEMGGSGFTYQSGRPVASAGAALTSLRVTDADGRELIRYEELSLGLASFATGVADGNLTLYGLLHGGNDVLRAGPDWYRSVDGWTGADTIFGNHLGLGYNIDDASDGLILPGGGGDFDSIGVAHGATGAIVSLSLAGRFAGIEALSYFGAGHLRASGNGADNFIDGRSGNDTISGGGGADRINGSNGNDSLSGGAGDDELQGVAGDDTLLGGAGHDTLSSESGTVRFDGGSGDDFLLFFGGAGILLGGAGNDTMLAGGTEGASTLAGGAGNDSLSNTEPAAGHRLDGGAGDDTLVAFGRDHLLLGGTGNDAITGAGTLDGGAGNDILVAAGTGNLLLGGTGDDILRVDFGAGATLRGGAGRDLIQLDGAGERIVIEDFRQGEDRIDLTEIVRQRYGAARGFDDLIRDGVLSRASVDGGTELTIATVSGTRLVFLRGVVDVLPSDFVLGGASLTGTSGHDVIRATPFTSLVDGQGGNDRIELNAANAEAFGGAGNDTLLVAGRSSVTLEGGLGNDSLCANFADGALLQGAAGNDTLIVAGSGSATLEGGAGNDLYILRDTLPQITEAADGGIDTVGIDIDGYTLGENLEHLYQINAGYSRWVARGNDLNNRITGGRLGSSNLDGGRGNDTLTGGWGDDTLIGGEGADRMIGGAGNDLYFVDHVADRAVESARQGYDTVEVSGLAAYALGANLEELSYLGQGDFRGTGNGLHNRLVGNDGADTLSGGGGNDTLVGGAGADLLIGGSGADLFVLGQGAADIVADFSRAQGDRLDITALLTGNFATLIQSGRIGWSAQGSDLAISIDGEVATILRGQAALATSLDETSFVY